MNPSLFRTCPRHCAPSARSGTSRSLSETLSDSTKVLTSATNRPSPLDFVCCSPKGLPFSPAHEWRFLFSAVTNENAHTHARNNQTHARVSVSVRIGRLSKKSPCFVCNLASTRWPPRELSVYLFFRGEGELYWNWLLMVRYRSSRVTFGYLCYGIFSFDSCFLRVIVFNQFGSSSQWSTC